MRHSLTNLSDEQLVQTFLSTEDKTYFTEIYQRYKDRIYQKVYGFAVVPEDADDLFQEVFVKLYFILPSFKS